MDTLSLAPQSESKDIKIIDKKNQDTTKTQPEDFFESLISSLLSDISDEKSRKFLLDNLLHISQKSEPGKINLLKIPATASNDTPKESKKEEFSKKSDVTIDLLLKIALSLQHGETPRFPTQSEPLKTALKKPDVIEAFRSATTIGDLIKIAKKNDIEVKNFQIFKEEAALDPKAKQVINKIKSEEIFKLITHRKIEPVKNTAIAPRIKIDHSSSSHIEPGKNIETSILQSILQTKSKEKTPAKKTFQPSFDTNTKDTIEPLAAHKEIKNGSDKLQKKKLQDPTVMTENPRQNPIETISPLDQKPASHPTQKEQKAPLLSSENVKTEKLNEPVTSIGEKELKTDKILPDETVDSEISHSHEIKTASTASVKQKHSTPSRQTFQTFAEEFREKVESYKPPLMKIKMELNPKNLGEVDVTLIHRGNNLHVTINSNPSTIAIFTQNQNEFKNAMVNMGFTGLQMNFSENGKNGQNERNQKQHSGNERQNTSENEPRDEFEIVVPRYV
ncbi:MAG: hypothetical protein B6D59_05280 [Campylobacteraceae bacterium 4484_4]|nr:MAG: hypothetical protein B6D59_05280 [Campylobacteraceae bacterium 4484_4]